MATPNVHDIRDTGPSGDGRRNGYNVSPAVFWLMSILSLCAIVFFILLCLWGWGPHNGGNHQAVAETAIIDRPADFFGHTVTTGGTVEKVIGTQQFTIATGPNGAPLLVLLRKPMSANNARQGGVPLAPGEVAVVNGTVRKFERDRLARDLNVTLAPDVYGPWEGKPVLVADADSVAVTSARTQQAAAQ